MKEWQENNITHHSVPLSETMSRPDILLAARGTGVGNEDEDERKDRWDPRETRELSMGSESDAGTFGT